MKSLAFYLLSTVYRVFPINMGIKWFSVKIQQWQTTFRTAYMYIVNVNENDDDFIIPMLIGPCIRWLFNSFFSGILSIADISEFWMKEISYLRIYCIINKEDDKK